MNATPVPGTEHLVVGARDEYAAGSVYDLNRTDAECSGCHERITIDGAGEWVHDEDWNVACA